MVVDTEWEALEDTEKVVQGEGVGVAGLEVAMGLMEAVVVVEEVGQKVALEVMVTGLVLAAAVRVVLVDMEGELLGERDVVMVGLEVGVPGLEVAKGVMVPVMQVVGDMEGVEETVKVAGLVDTTPVRVILVDMEGEVLEVTE